MGQMYIGVKYQMFHMKHITGHEVPGLLQDLNPLPI